MVMLLNKKLQVVIFLFAFAIRTQAQQSITTIDKLMQGAANSELFNGAIVVIDNGKVLYNKQFGFANSGLNQKNNINTLFNLCSISKQFTAMGIMMLEEKGKLKYTDSLRMYFPELPYKNITVEHLLTHTSGLPDYMLLAFNQWPEGNTYSNAEAIQLLVKNKPSVHFQPGDKFQYSNTGYMLLASIIEKLSGMSYSSFIKENIFSPLKMNRSFVYTPQENEKRKQNIAVGYVFDRLKVENLPAEKSFQFGKQVKTIIYTIGDGGIYSTASDMIKWYESLSAGGLVKPATMAKAFTSAKLNNGHDVGYGYGWFVVNDSVYGSVLQHTGGWPGFRHAFIITPSKKRMLLVLRNTEIEFKGIQLSINNILDSKPFVKPQSSLGQFLGIAAQKGIEPLAIQSIYNEYKTNSIINESEINDIGYGVKEKGFLKQSLEIMKINAELHPKSWNVFDSLGELYLLNGDKENAKINYQKSLNLNPQNESAKKALQNL